MSYECGHCLGNIDRKEQCMAVCQGKTITSKKKFEIEYYHTECWIKDNLRFGIKDMPVTKTPNQWKTKFNEQYNRFRIKI